MGIGRSEVRNVAVEADRPGLRGNLPFRSAKEDANVAVIDGGDARGDRLGFERMIDGGEENSVIGDVDNGAAASEVGDDFIFLGEGGECGRESGQQEYRGAREEVAHRGRVAQRGRW